MSRHQKIFFRWFRFSISFFSLAFAVWIYFPTKTVSLTTICIQNDHIAFWDISETYENSGIPDSKNVLSNSASCAGIWNPKENAYSANHTQDILHPNLSPSEYILLNQSYSNLFSLSLWLSRAPPLA